jgi:transcriptional regulator
VYLPSSFEESRIDVLHALMRAHPLATLLTQDTAGIVANHVPVDAVPAPAPLGVLRGHIARANPLWRTQPEGQSALAIFQGPQVYISPSMYPTKAATGEVVPTWDYAVVHVRGTLRFIHDTEWLHELVTTLTDAHEAPRRAPWKLSDAPAAYVGKMLDAIVGFELSIASLTGKWKVSQNRNSADRQGVISGLRASPDPDALEIADMLASRHATL